MSWHGAGLYRIDPAAVDPNLQPLPIPNFFPVGHLAITPDGCRPSPLPSRPTTLPRRYDQLVQVQLPLGRGGNLPRIASAGVGQRRPRGHRASAAASPAGLCRGRAGLEQGGARPRGRQRRADRRRRRRGRGDRGSAAGRRWATRSASLSPTAMGCRLIDARNGSFVERVLPAAPGRADLGRGHRHGTATAPDSPGLRPELRVEHHLGDRTGAARALTSGSTSPPSRRYRKAMLEAYADLLGGFLQYLKDCFFDHFVVRCPQPTGEEALELACISIRDKQVYKVCNFSRRRYVKSFPTAGVLAVGHPRAPRPEVGVRAHRLRGAGPGVRQVRGRERPATTASRSSSCSSCSRGRSRATCSADRGSCGGGRASRPGPPASR